MLAEADALIHASPIHDPFPNAVLEGMAASLMILGSDCSGSVVDRVDHGVNGCIHRAGDVQQLAEQIAEVLRKPTLVGEMGRLARIRAEEWPAAVGVDLLSRVFCPQDPRAGNERVALTPSEGSAPFRLPPHRC